jgi:hypothetical protein
MTKDDDTRARILVVENGIKKTSEDIANINTNVALIAKSVSIMPDEARVKEISRDVVELERLRALERRELSKKSQAIDWQRWKPVIKYSLMVIVTTVLAVLGMGSITV